METYFSVFLPKLISAENWKKASIHGDNFKRHQIATDADNNKKVEMYSTRNILKILLELLLKRWTNKIQ